MKHGKIARIFDYWSAYVKKVLRVRRFVIKQVNGLKYTMFINLRTYAGKEIADRRLGQQKYCNVCIGHGRRDVYCIE